MIYRKIPNCNIDLSIIGFGTASLSFEKKEAQKAIYYAIKNGINYFDFATQRKSAFTYAGEILSQNRNNTYIQCHFGLNYSNGKYIREFNLENIKRNIDWQLKELKTEYIDFGMIHCMDDESQWNKYINNGILKYLMYLNKCGVVKKIGLSSHSPKIAKQIIKETPISLLMFSINPAYDNYFRRYAVGTTEERFEFY